VIEVEVKILNEEGLHARPAGLLVKTASQYKSQIEVEFNGKKVNAKSLLSLMSLGLTKDSAIRIFARGDDAANAVESLQTLIANQFR
jgi:phosphocarrier protein HPr